MDLIPTLATALAAYLLGSVPFGLVMARAFGLGDIRKIGSGNIGATNVLRTGNKLAAGLTLIGDAGKGAVAVLLARWLVGESAAGIAGLFAMLGHLYPVFLGFKGGKGVATFLGTLLALSFPVGLAACATWLAVALAFRISSLSALAAAMLAPIYTVVFYHWHGAVLVAILSALVIFKHRDNIRRLRAGTEPRIGRERLTTPDAFLAAFDALPEGTFRGKASGRRYIVSKTSLVGGRSQKLVARELGGTDYISLNLYRTGRRAHLRPCEMPEPKVMDFVVGLQADTAP